MSFFPWLVLLLLMALIAEIAVVAPRAIRSIVRREPVHVTPASAKAVVMLVGIQLVHVVAWAVLFAREQGV